MIAQLDKYYLKSGVNKLYQRFVSYFLFEGRPLTTRGRFINGFVLLWFYFIDVLPFKGSVQKPVFILGTGRSGTTILGKLLGIHKQMSFLNEPKLIWHYAIRNEDLAGSYSAEPGKLRFDETDFEDEVLYKLNKIYSAYRFLTGSNFIVDKYPELIFRIKYVKKIFPDAKFILIIRNGIQTSYSIKNWNTKFAKFRNGNKEDWWGLNDRKWKILLEEAINNPIFENDHAALNKISKDEEKGAVEWILTMNEALRYMNDPNFIVVRFEELITDYRSNLDRITKFINIRLDERVNEYASEILKPEKSTIFSDLPPYLTEKIFLIYEKFKPA
jgi:hypothetical protein